MRFSRKQVLATVALIVCAAALVVAAVKWGPEAFVFFADGDRLQAWIESQGPLAQVAMVGLVIAQTVAAVLPGEPLELGAGYAFGFWEGTVLCLLGNALGTLIIVVLVRRLGMRVVEVFVSREKLESVKWLQDSARFEVLMFVIFLIPGTPKDALTYLAALTTCPFRRIVAITTVGRIPSVVSSTLAASFAADGSWVVAGAVMAVTLVLAVAGAAAYAFIARRKTAVQR